ncbi:MAG: GGDEF domain-containing protein [Natronospirillum sp.]|uniref:GGDEF domain-containing protein n=1 Tax=Natronospirillum sp. TaxID=2812955 RepID=UPI0025D95FC3|nr:GGDEF domain-containing protein [Natronospirillum sp.]MCH8551003.1 GGDEF domain-containing protein [Natronospirillum sp.]
MTPLRYATVLQVLFPRIPAEWKEEFLDHERRQARRIAVVAAVLTLLALPAFQLFELIFYRDTPAFGLHNALWRIPVMGVVLLILVLRCSRPNGNWPRPLLQLFAIALLLMTSGMVAIALMLEHAALHYTLQGLIISLAAVSMAAIRGLQDLPVIYGLPMLALIIVTQLNNVPLGQLANYLINPAMMIVVGSAIAGLLYHGAVSAFLANQHLREAATTDPLTGLLNRRAMSAELAMAVSHQRRHNQSFALIMADLDHFKQINDAHGHDVGDEVLIELGQRLKKAVRLEDRVARWGGEEFLLLIQEVEEKAAFDVAEKIRLAIGKTAFVTSAAELDVTISLGLVLSDSGGTVDGLITMADRALYEAKRNGRNRTEVMSRQKT